MSWVKSNKYVEMFYNVEWKKCISISTDLNTLESSNVGAEKIYSCKSTVTVKAANS